MPTYVEAKEVADIAVDLINDHHVPLQNIDIGYLFRSGSSKSSGPVSIGQVVRVDDRNNFFNAKDVIMEVPQEVWSALSLDNQRILVDHNLSHIGVEVLPTGEMKRDPAGRVKVTIKHHEIEEFSSIMHRYKDIHGEFRKAIRELSDPPPPPPPKSLAK